MNRVVSDRELSGAQIPEPRTGKKVCVVTGELEGPFFNGGVGTQNRALAIVLRKLGYEVDILYTQVNRGTPFCLRGAFADHVAAFQNLGIRLLCIDNEEESTNWHARSFLALQHLLRNRYDLVFFDDMLGTAYYPLLARRTDAPSLRDTKMSVTLHGSVEWAADLNEAPVSHFEGLPLMEMERRSIELADSVRAGSAYIFRKYQSYGWTIADNHVVLPNFVSGGRAAAQSLKKVEINEIVFFGRLETRKGLWTFCRALDRLKYVLAGQRVTFLGKMTPETGDILIKRSATWPFPVRFLNNFNREQAIAYLKRDGRLAVMPSTEDNNPSVILECLEEGIPFLASSGSGGEELLDKESQGNNLFEPTVDGLCAKLLETLADGGMTARASFDPEQLQTSFAEWVENLIDSPAPVPPKQAEPSLAPLPVLFVIVPSEFRPDQAISEFRNTLQAFAGRVQIEALTAEPEFLRPHLADILNVNVSPFQNFPALARSLASRAATVVGLCHIKQMLSPKWAERAQSCFAKNENIAALTGMTATEREPDSRPREPFFSTLKRHWSFERYITGFAPPLFSLRQDTNAGFAWIRSDLLALVSDVLPVDVQYDRPRSMENWIHEILVTLHIAGKRFELVPDQLVEQPNQEVPFEAMRSADFMRSLATKLHGYAPGTDQWLLSRVAIDMGLEQERTRRNAGYLKSVAATFAADIAPVSAYASREQSYPYLAQIAHAAGQIDIAVGLLAALVLPEKGSDGSKIGRHVEFSARAVRLADFLGGTQCVRLNLNHPWSFKIVKEGKEFELHANSAGEGRAALSFTSIDLSHATRFACALRLPSHEAHPVHVRVDVIPPDRTTDYYAAEKILQPGDDCQWAFEIPEAVRTTCTVLFSVDLVDPRDLAEHAYTMIADARFE
jgi:glycosyltransferase involved in cell wall biosynthesis